MEGQKIPIGMPDGLLPHCTCPPRLARLPFASLFNLPSRVVCPVALVSQWASEIKKYAIGLTVIEHHGPSRTTSMVLHVYISALSHSIFSLLGPDVLKKAHVVITSYSIVTSEHATFSPPSKDEGSKAKVKPKPKPKKTSSGSDSDCFIVDDSDDSADHFGRTIGKKRGKGKKAERDSLFRIKWWRVVLGILSLSFERQGRY
jgi:SNF2 family DNA or RNA helicase